MTAMVVDDTRATPAGLTAFICYRHEFRRWADTIRDVLREAGCDASMDDEHVTSTISHRLQSKARMSDRDCVVVVLPPNFVDWLPLKFPALEAKILSDRANAFEVEILNVLELIQRDRGKPVLLFMLQESGRPVVRELPEYFRDHPNVVECGEGVWREKAAKAIQAIRATRARPDSIQPRASADLETLETELTERIPAWSSGRIGVQVKQRKSDASRFEYQSSFYIKLPAALGVDSADRMVRSADAEAAHDDVVSFILNSSFQRGWLIGDTGSGKTIALTRIGAMAARAWCDWAKRSRNSPSAGTTAAPSLPILLKYSALYPAPSVNVADRTEMTGALLFKGLAESLGRTVPGLKALLGNWRCLVMLDGFDEVVDPEATDNLERLILLMGQAARDLRILVTARARDYRPSFENSEVITLQSLSFGRGTKLVEQIANARRDIRPRVMQVAQVMREAHANAEPHFLTSPQAITIACLLASQPDDRPVDMRFGELLDRWLTAACGPDGTYVIDRRALRVIALEAVRQAQQSVKMKRVEEILGENGLACQSQSLEEDLDRLAGIVQVVRKDRVHYAEFAHTALRDYLAAEAVADWPPETVLTRARREFAGWARVIEYLPALLARREQPNAEDVLLRHMAEAGQQNDAAAPAIWLAGLRSLVSDPALQQSDAAQALVRGAYAAVSRPECGWNPHMRAEVLDACGLAGRSILGEFLSRQWVPIPELDTSSTRRSIASAPVTVVDFSEFLNSPDNQARELWPDGVEPSLRDFEENGGWGDQLRTPLRPITGVTWFEALAYCAWMTRGSRRQIVRLPSPDEWCEVARPGRDSRRFPWGEATAGFNYRQVGLRRPSPVGLFPPYCRSGLFDFGSNVYEWSAPTAAAQEDEAEVHGGCWSDFLDTIYIGRPKRFFRRIVRRPDTGFRCIREEHL